jgi:hypothetical protein
MDETRIEEGFGLTSQAVPQTLMPWKNSSVIPYRPEFSDRLQSFLG